MKYVTMFFREWNISYNLVNSHDFVGGSAFKFSTYAQKDKSLYEIQLESEGALGYLISYRKVNELKKKSSV